MERSAASSVGQFYAMTGCTAPDNPADRGCQGELSPPHISLEGWTGSYQPAWDEIQANYPATAPKSLGSMGYYGLFGTFVPEGRLSLAPDPMKLS